jgi:thiosulfate/3-mercaptopyruvate sulfurtransferase
MRQLARLALVLTAATLISFNSAAATKAPTTNPMVVSSDRLAGMSGTSSLVILHISRDRTSYDQGHILGARLIQLNQLAVSRDGNDNELPSVQQLKDVFEAAGVSSNSRVVLYDDAQGLLAARAYFTLDYLGVGSRTALLDGGLEKWIADGRTLDRTSPTFVRGNIKPVVRRGIVVQYSQMRELAAQAIRPGSRVVLIDARSPQQFGPGTSLNAKDGGHIPGSKNVFWMDTLEKAPGAVFRSADSIQSTYRNAGVRPGSKVIVYCNTGVQASHAYFTLKWLGYDVALYDGSFQDWARHADARIE